MHDMGRGLGAILNKVGQLRSGMRDLVHSRHANASCCQGCATPQRADNDGARVFCQKTNDLGKAKAAGRRAYVGLGAAMMVAGWAVSRGYVSARLWKVVPAWSALDCDRPCCVAVGQF
jgi:hypothetical protein